MGQTNKEKLDYINSLAKPKNKASTRVKSQSSAYQPKRQQQGNKKSAVAGPNQIGSDGSNTLESFGCLFCIIGFIIALFAKDAFGGGFLVWFAVSTILTSIVGTCLVDTLKGK